MKNKKKNILLFTSKDFVDSPEVGGIDVYLYEVANRLAKKHNVTVFSAKYPGQKSKQTANGVKYIRRGSRITVFVHAFFHYLFNINKIRSDSDFIIDLANGLPFFTPLYTKKPKLALLPHFHNSMWFKEFPFPISAVGYTIERFLMPFVYKGVKFITISNSSRLDLEFLGINSDNIDLAYCGVQRLNAPKNSRSYKDPTILYLGRLKKYKRVDLAIKAVSRLKNEIPNIKLLIAGLGDDEDRLKELVKEEKLEKNVTFLGFVPESEKANLMAKSWVFTNPSEVEGWGIVNIEANSVGTPALGFNVCGTRDSINNGFSGLLADNFDDYVQKMNALLVDRQLLKQMSKNSLEWAKNFNWDYTTKIFEQEITSQLGFKAAKAASKQPVFALNYFNK